MSELAKTAFVNSYVDKRNAGTSLGNHNPFLCFGGAYKDTWQLFGHVHSGPNSPRNGLDESRLKYLFPTQYDVGVDNNDYRPISYAQVRAKIQEQVKKEANL